MRCAAPRHTVSAARQRLGNDGMERLHRVLRGFYLSCGSYQKCAAELGVGVTAVQRVLSGGVDISEELADKIAAKLGTTADAIARGSVRYLGRGGMSALVDEYAAALRALAKVAGVWSLAPAIADVGRDVLRKAAPCESCGGNRVTGHERVEGSAPGQDLPIPRPCITCRGAGWTQVSLDAHIADEDRCAELNDAVLEAADLLERGHGLPAFYRAIRARREMGS